MPDRKPGISLGPVVVLLVRRMYIREAASFAKFFAVKPGAGGFGGCLWRGDILSATRSPQARGFEMLRILTLVFFLAIAAVSASAYIVVMRDGRQVQIPNQFVLTSSTLTYEIAPGMQVTIQLNTVDIAATEQANGQAKGSFLLRATAPEPAAKRAPQQIPRSNAQRSITNADLEGYRRTRVDSEKAYESHRKELGLPSLEERRREAAAIQDRTIEQIRKMREQQEREAEAERRNRAELLRMANEAQMGFSRRPDDSSLIYSWGGFPEFSPFGGFSFGIGHGGFRRFGRFASSDPFAGFLATPITPFPRFATPFRRPVFIAPGGHLNRGRSHGRFNRR